MIEIKAKLVNGKIEVDESLLPKIDSEINIQILENGAENGNGVNRKFPTENMLKSLEMTKGLNPDNFNAVIENRNEERNFINNLNINETTKITKGKDLNLSQTVIENRENERW